MQPIQFSPSHYTINGKPVYLYSGEFHYFRVPRKDWRTRMRLLKEAGGNCVATYVPWLIHEPVEGEFRFDSDDGVLNLEEFLGTANEMGLYVIARPGPYQYSELKYDGLPGWLCEAYPQLRAHTIDGQPFRTSSISYLHPLLLDKARRWFSQVCPIIARHTVSRGGPVAFTQLDNEMTGIHIWFGSLDYNAETMGIGQSDGRYATFLRWRYGDIASLNGDYNTAFSEWADVRPIKPDQAHLPADIRRAKDYFDFYLGTIAEYAQTLTDWMREFGIDTPVVHNSANPGMNTYFVETAGALRQQFLLGSDHYYSLDQTWPQNNPTPQYAATSFISMETLRLMGYPPTVYELPGGSLSDWPPITHQDARACYLTNLALGMKGHNFYIFTGGPNPPGAGVTCDVYDYGASISATGDVRPLYASQKALGDVIAAYPWLPAAEREFDCRIALDFEQPRSRQYWPRRSDFQFSNPEANDFLRQGLLTTALCASLSPVMVNLDDEDWIADRGAPLIVVASDSMSAAKQERIARFLNAGGKALIAPVLPRFDDRLRPCTLLADYLGQPRLEPNRNQYTRLTIGGVVNIFNNGESFFARGLPGGAKVIGRDELTGEVVAWQQTTPGNGQAIVLGFRWLHAKREHEHMLQAVLSRLGLRQRVICNNPNVWTSLRTSGNQSLLFLMNLLSSSMEAAVECWPAWSNAPVDAGHHTLAPMTVKVIELS